MHQTLQLQAEGHCRKQETRPNDKRETTGSEVLQAEERTCADWTVTKAVWTPRGRYVLVVRRRSGADVRTSIPPLQPVERPAKSALQGGGEGHRRECGQMPTRADF